LRPLSNDNIATIPIMVMTPAMRITFKAERPAPKPKTEKLVEVCGHYVPEIRAAAAVAECAPKSQDADEGGKDSLILP